MRPISMALLLVCLIASDAMAEEQSLMIAHSGSWVTFEHRPSGIALPNVCYTASIGQNITVFLRSGSNHDFEIRLANDAWSLPSHAAGEVSFKIGDWGVPLQAVSNGATMLDVYITEQFMETFIDHMDNGSSMSVTVGNSPAVRFSLAGSTRATNAFRTCAGLTGNAPIPGGNPFN